MESVTGECWDPINNADDKAKENEDPHSKLEYSINDIPPIHISLVYGLQQVIANISGPLSTVYIIHLTLCTAGREADLFFAQMLSTSIFMMGIASFIQCTFGVRLPIVQGSSAAFIPPVLAMMSTEEWKCPPVLEGNSTYLTTSSIEIDDEPWKPRLREISGCLMAASLVQIILGCTGVMGFLMNYIGPLTICPTVALIGLSLFETATAGAQHQWGIALLTVALVVVFSMILGNTKVPLPTWTRKSGFAIQYFKIFRLFPHIFAILISWLLCYILTVTEVFTDDEEELGYLARTDAKLNVLYESKWFFFPYPFQWGRPTFSIGLFVGLIAATLASIIESVGDYYATAKTCHLPPPPKHAVNRGIAVEGISSVISGLVGAAHATTSYSGTVGFIQITGVASRFVWQIMSVMFIIFGVFGKVGAALTIIPDPIIGALAIVGLGMVIPVGLSTLQYVNMNSSRNQLILAISLMLGMMLPFWMKDNPGVIQTGNDSLDQLIEVFLSTGMFIGGVLGFTLDNLIPGTKKERGLISFNAQYEDNENSGNATESDLGSTYDLPFITKCLRKVKCCTYVPFLPSYTGINVNLKCCKKSENVNNSTDFGLTTANDRMTTNYGVRNSSLGEDNSVYVIDTLNTAL